jgi:hypothetical protein
MSNDRRPLKILFSMRHLGSLRMYESVIRDLAAHGHQLHMVIDRKEKLGWQKGLDQVLSEFPNVTWSWAVRQRRVQYWFEFSRLVRIWLDYLRYFGPSYAEAPILRRRAADLLPAWIVRATDRWPLRTTWGRDLLRKALRAAERALPRVDDIDEMVARHAPDVMLITPLIYLGSPQVEMLRSAKALGVRTALCVGSWDHLSSKAVIRDVPHRIFVWNETQKDEAVTLHGVPPDQVVVTGAQCYDQWFGRRSGRDGGEFRRNIGLASDRPFLLYACSALFWGSPVEAEFIVSWIESLRRSPFEELRSIGILIRPHPARRDEWNTIDLARFENVTLYGSSPIDHDSRNDYFDSLFHCAAVVGLNTSAFLEAAIVGRPVHTILPAEFRDNQEGTLHFSYLMTVGGGLLRAARDFDEHQRQLMASLRDPVDNAPFVTAFIRPAGLNVPATAVFVDAIERLGADAAPSPATTPWRYRVLRSFLFPVALLTRLLFLILGKEGQVEGAAGVADRVQRGFTSAKDRLSREAAKQRKWERKQQTLAARAEAARAAERRLDEDRSRKRAELQQHRAARRAEILKQRQARIDEDHRAKEQQRSRRRREKSAHAWRKWRQNLGRRILGRLGRA